MRRTTRQSQTRNAVKPVTNSKPQQQVAELKSQQVALLEAMQYCISKFTSTSRKTAFPEGTPEPAKDLKEAAKPSANGMAKNSPKDQLKHIIDAAKRNEHVEDYLDKDGIVSEFQTVIIPIKLDNSKSLEDAKMAIHGIIKKIDDAAELNRRTPSKPRKPADTLDTPKRTSSKPKKPAAAADKASEAKSATSTPKAKNSVAAKKKKRRSLKSQHEANRAALQIGQVIAAAAEAPAAPLPAATAPTPPVGKEEKSAAIAITVTPAALQSPEPKAAPAPFASPLPPTPDAARVAEAAKTGSKTNIGRVSIGYLAATGELYLTNNTEYDQIADPRVKELAKRLAKTHAKEMTLNFSNDLKGSLQFLRAFLSGFGKLDDTDAARMEGMVDDYETTVVEGAMQKLTSHSPLSTPERGTAAEAKSSTLAPSNAPASAPASAASSPVAHHDQYGRASAIGNLSTVSEGGESPAPAAATVTTEVAATPANTAAPMSEPPQTPVAVQATPAAAPATPVLTPIPNPYAETPAVAASPASGSAMASSVVEPVLLEPVIDPTALAKMLPPPPPAAELAALSAEGAAAMSIEMVAAGISGVGGSRSASASDAAPPELGTPSMEPAVAPTLPPLLHTPVAAPAAAPATPAPTPVAAAHPNATPAGAAAAMAVNGVHAAPARPVSPPAADAKTPEPKLSESEERISKAYNLLSKALSDDATKFWDSTRKVGGGISYFVTPLYGNDWKAPENIAKMRHAIENADSKILYDKSFNPIVKKRETLNEIRLSLANLLLPISCFGDMFEQFRKNSVFNYITGVAETESSWKRDKRVHEFYILTHDLISAALENHNGHFAERYATLEKFVNETIYPERSAALQSPAAGK